MRSSWTYWLLTVSLFSQRWSNKLTTSILTIRSWRLQRSLGISMKRSPSQVTVICKVHSITHRSFICMLSLTWAERCLVPRVITISWRTLTSHSLSSQSQQGRELMGKGWINRRGRNSKLLMTWSLKNWKRRRRFNWMSLLTITPREEMASLRLTTTSLSWETMSKLF
jgi:hypothetical protein